MGNTIVGFDSVESLQRVVGWARAGALDGSPNRVPRAEGAIHVGFDFFIGKTSGAIAKGATNGTVTIWDSATDASAVAASSSTLTNVWNPFADVGATKYVLVIQLPFAYMLCAAEC